MRNAICVALVCFLAGVLGGATLRGATSNLKQLKRQQKLERRQLKLEQKIWKRSFRGRNIPRAERDAAKHELGRNMRTLRVEQKNEIQQFKDRERIAKYRNSHPLY